MMLNAVIKQYVRIFEVRQPTGQLLQTSQLSAMQRMRPPEKFMASNLPLQCFSTKKAQDTGPGGVDMLPATAWLDFDKPQGVK